MEAIVKVLGFFIGLFVFVNGIWIWMMHPSGDEVQGIVIMAIGIVIPLIVLGLARLDAKREC
jgi:hypothetical protein